MANNKINSFLMDEYTKNIYDVWESERMRKYCIGKVSNLCKLSNGALIEFEKPSIETSFCFDDSYDYEGAQDMAHHARTSEQYFLRENLKEFNKLIEVLKSKIDECNGIFTQTEYYHLNNCDLYVAFGRYSGQDENNTLSCLQWLTPWEFEERPHPRTYKLGLEDLQVILAVYEEERTKFEKRLHSYLKRYGLTKINSWTYWGMA